MSLQACADVGDALALGGARLLAPGTTGGRGTPAAARRKAARSPRPARAWPATRPCAAGRSRLRRLLARRLTSRYRGSAASAAVALRAELALQVDHQRRQSSSLGRLAASISTFSAQRSSRKATKVSWRWLELVRVRHAQQQRAQVGDARRGVVDVAVEVVLDRRRRRRRAPRRAHSPRAARAIRAAAPAGRRGGSGTSSGPV